ncbi:hypothetical protein LINPERHAP2_LOCUS25330 [Linum perenne]
MGMVKVSEQEVEWLIKVEVEVVGEGVQVEVLTVMVVEEKATEILVVKVVEGEVVVVVAAVVVVQQVGMDTAVDTGWVLV